MPKVVPIRDSYENVHALLAAIGEEPDLVGFAGVVVLGNGDLIPVVHGLDRPELSLVGTVMHRLSLEEDTDDVDGSRG